MESVPQLAPRSGGAMSFDGITRGDVEERLRLALEAGEMGAWEYRIPEERVIWSETLERIHGLAPGSFGGTFDDYQRDIHPDDRATVFETLSNTLAGAPHKLRYRIVRPDGVTRWVEARGTLLRDENGAPHRVIGICTDITEREEANAAMEAHRAELERKTMTLETLNLQLQYTNEALLLAREDAEAAERNVSGILNAITDPFVVHDRDWRFRYVNEAAARVLGDSLGLSGESLIGKSLWELYPDIAGTRFEREMRRSQSERIPVTFSEFYARRATWSEQTCYPLEDGGLASIWKDVTAEKQAAQRQHYLSEASNILGSSLEYRTTVAKLAQLLVPELADWCGVQLLDEHAALQQLAVAHVDPVKVDWAWTLNRRYPVDMSAPTGIPNVLRTGVSEHYDDVTDEMLQLAAVDQEHLHILRELGMTSVLIVPLKVRDRVFGAMTLVAAESGRRYTDADRELAEQLAERASFAIDNARLYSETEQARMALEESREELTISNEELSHTNEELAAKTRLAEQSRAEAEAANRSKADFLAHMSHELRTPLNAIAGYSELMELGLHGPLTPEQVEDLRRIKRSQRHLLSLINDVLNFAKLEAAHVSYDIKAVSIPPTVASLDALIAPQLAAKSLHYDASNIEPGLEALGDEEKIQQVLLNLLSNSVKFTPPGGRITVTAARTENLVCIEVADTGCGIAPEKQHRVFEPFVQLERTLSSPHEGTGLGLAISRDLARGMGGDLTVESVPGEGATFTLRLRATDG